MCMDITIIFIGVGKASLFLNKNGNIYLHVWWEL